MSALTSIEVQGLLGQFNHKVKFPEDSEFVILHGPNGVGKTKLLELISATFAANFIGVMRIPFSSVLFGFSDGTALHITRVEQLSIPEEDEVDAEGNIQLRFIFSPAKASKDIAWDAPPSAEVLRMFRDSGLAERRGIMARDLRFDSPAIADILERPPYRFTRIYRHACPPDLMAFFREVNVHLIETQRLLNPSHRRTTRRPRDESEAQRATVLEFSQDITQRISDALAENSRRSQQLDRKFPRRLMADEKLPPEATEEAIRERYERQGELRQRLSDISLLDEFPDMPLPSKSLQDWQRRVLWTYLDDTDQKLSTFDPLLDRVDLLRDIVNSRFLYKELKIDRERGFYFVTPGSARLDASMLSSGEQHELVLAYDLLFNAPENSIVLIDEPEISLHVSWQQEFLADIKRIANLNSLRFIVATHSPQVVHTWWSRTIALGPDSN
jgi:predicted ATP-binding protein involved in virulence